MTLPPTWMDTGIRRRLLSAIARDAFRVSDRLTLTATVRHDDYDDLGAFTSPRAAAVWRINDQNILKLQYAKAFRPPTFYELAFPGPGAIEAAEIATYELGDILRRSLWEARVILFRSDLTDPILFDELGSGGFTNGPDAELRGVELEYLQRLGRRLKIDANLSYVDATDTATGDDLPGGASLLGNLAFLWQARDHRTAALQWRYVGERSREPNDPRPPLDPYSLLDLTLNWHASTPGLDLHLGIKNLADSQVRYADQFQSFGGIPLPYPDSYPRPGRQLWLSVGYRF
ncbi:MAG: TonB-dependent receptor plug domain-containing protein [Bdellovibrio bacteriovorus]